jgi:hypothetical protein
LTSLSLKWYESGMIRSTLWLSVVLLALAGCKKPRTQTQASPNPKPLLGKVQHREKIDACALITKQEVEAIQVTSIIEAMSSEGLSGNFLVSQCYYNSGEPNKSVSLAVTRANPNKAAGPDPAEYWKETFSISGDDKKGEEAKDKKERAEGDKGKKGRDTRGREEEEKMPPPKKIEGVGEEAYWAGDRVGGALYVLKKDVFIRISVGGPDNEEIKISKSKALAQKALQRL